MELTPQEAEEVLADALIETREACWILAHALVELHEFGEMCPQTIMGLKGIYKTIGE